MANQNCAFLFRSWIFVTNLTVRTIVANIVLYNLINITVIAFSGTICTSFDILIEWTCCTSIIFHHFQGCTIDASTGCIWYLVDCTRNTLTGIGTILFKFKMVHFTTLKMSSLCELLLVLHHHHNRHKPHFLFFESSRNFETIPTQQGIFLKSKLTLRR